MQDHRTKLTVQNQELTSLQKLLHHLHQQQSCLKVKMMLIPLSYWIMQNRCTNLLMNAEANIQILLGMQAFFTSKLF
jgi:hypothetical protein